MKPFFCSVINKKKKQKLIDTSHLASSEKEDLKDSGIMVSMLIDPETKKKHILDMCLKNWYAQDILGNRNKICERRGGGNDSRKGKQNGRREDGEGRETAKGGGNHTRRGGGTVEGGKGH